VGRGPLRARPRSGALRGGPAAGKALAGDQRRSGGWCAGWSASGAGASPSMRLPGRWLAGWTPGPSGRSGWPRRRHSR
jgi:hypothetical protein